MKKFIKIPIFNQRIWFTSKEDAEKYCSNLESYEAVCYIGKNERLCFYQSQELSDDTIVHESVHLAHILLGRVLIISKPFNDEPLAYLTAYIYEELKKIVKP